MQHCSAGLSERCDSSLLSQFEVRKNDLNSIWMPASSNAYSFSANEIAQLRCPVKNGWSEEMYGPEFIVCLMSGPDSEMIWSKRPWCGYNQRYAMEPNRKTLVDLRAPYDFSYEVKNVPNANDGRKILELTKKFSRFTLFPPGRTCSSLSIKEPKLNIRMNDEHSEWADFQDEVVLWHNEIAQFKCKDPDETADANFAVCLWGTLSLPHCSPLEEEDETMLVDDESRNVRIIAEKAPFGYTYKEFDLKGDWKQLNLIFSDSKHCTRIRKLQHFPFLENCLMDFGLNHRNLIGNYHNDRFKVDELQLQQGEFIKLSCPTGYMIDGDDWVGCIDGHLYPELPYCRSPCGFSIENPLLLPAQKTWQDGWPAWTSQMDLNQLPGFPHGFRIWWICKPGYVHYGSNRTQCFDGAWVGDQGWCEAL